MILPSDFKEFLRLLNLKQVRYLLVGGYAVSLYGYPRPTGDLDLWVEPTPENAARLVEAIRAFGFDTPQLSDRRNKRAAGRPKDMADLDALETR